jgi:hypothetical protein
VFFGFVLVSLTLTRSQADRPLPISVVPGVLDSTDETGDPLYVVWYISSVDSHASSNNIFSRPQIAGQTEHSYYDLPRI